MKRWVKQTQSSGFKMIPSIDKTISELKALNFELTDEGEVD